MYDFYVIIATFSKQFTANLTKPYAYVIPLKRLSLCLENLKDLKDDNDRMTDNDRLICKNI